MKRAHGPAALDEDWKKERARFIALLDPSLEPGEGTKTPVSIAGGGYGSEGGGQ